MKKRITSLSGRYLAQEISKILACDCRDLAQIVFSECERIPSDSDMNVFLGNNWKTKYPDIAKICESKRFGGPSIIIPKNHDDQLVLFHNACRAGRADVVQKMLDEECDLSDRNLVGGWEDAVSGGHLELMKLLYPLVKSSCSISDYGRAAKTGKLEVFRFICSHVKFDLGDRYFKDALHDPLLVGLLADAITGGNLEIVKFALNKGAPLFQVDKDGKKRTVHVQIAKEYTSVTSVQRHTPLAAAACYGHLDLVKFFESRKIPIHETVFYCGTAYVDALMLAAEHGKTDVCLYLISKGADPNAVNGDQMNSVLIAKKAGHTACANALIKAGGITSKYRLKALYEEKRAKVISE